MKIIFITRKYPPSIGGMEKLSYEITTRISSKNNVKIIALKKSQILLPFFFLYALVKGILESKKEKCIVHIGDGVLSPLGPLIKKITNAKIVLTLHGLDITYNGYMYQKIMPFFMKKFDKIICISNETIKQCIKRGINKNKCILIPIGVNSPKKIKTNKKETGEKVGITLENKKIILSVGRLVKRKGFHWFLSEVFPSILKEDKNVVYLIVGRGVMKKTIKQTIKEKSLEKNVFLLENVNDFLLEQIFFCSDVFVMPNIKVKNDVEGFGIVAIEAAVHGLPVVASNLEGIRNAITNGKNGILIKGKNKKKYQEVLTDLLENEKKREKMGANAKKYAKKNLSWNEIIKKYQKGYLDIY